MASDHFGRHLGTSQSKVFDSEFESRSSASGDPMVSLSDLVSEHSESEERRVEEDPIPRASTSGRGKSLVLSEWGDEDGTCLVGLSLIKLRERYS